MNHGFKSKRNSGTILIIALWTLGLLTFFAVEIGFGIRQKIALQKRLEERGKLQVMAQAGIKKAIAFLRTSIDPALGLVNKSTKSFLFNNPGAFSEIQFPEGKTEVFYEIFNGGTIDSIKKYGMMDEESKLNINKADLISLKTLIMHVLDWNEENSSALAEAILDWREPGESSLVGFYSDAYYENLEFPYPVKDAGYEVPDELLLVQGMNEEIMEKLLNHVTIYGEGKVNINSASRPVLLALGLSEVLTDKILAVRRGPDGAEATADDHIFGQAYDVAVEIGKKTGLEEAEVKAIDELNAQGKLTTVSYFYSIRSRAQLLTSAQQMEPDNLDSGGRDTDYHNVPLLLRKSVEYSNIASAIRCVFDAQQNKIVYWKEE